ncbi:MAG: RNA polymerase subunit sigma-24 [Planctomyces sp.]|nr:RNA polymerase subunit sigma-24 [Planctomyces sp.]
MHDALSRIYEEDSRRVFATLVRILGDFDLAEEAMHEAFAAASEQWPTEGIPENPVAWLVSTARFKAVDTVRRQKKLRELHPAVQQRVESIRATNDHLAEQDISDDRLRLIFTCCHPAIDRQIQVPLTLREVCGLTTEEIAHAFLTSSSTMAQRIVRGKSKIRQAGIPFDIPAADELNQRLDAVLAVIYLVFNEGYSASAGDSVVRRDLSEEAIRLARLVLELLPDAEVMGLLALMLLHESRREARSTPEGDIILLENQDRSLWNHSHIREGNQLVERALKTGQFGAYTIEAAISAVHANAPTAAETDWNQIVSLYDVLLQADPTPVIELNRAVAVAMRDSPAAGLELIDALLLRGELNGYHLAHAARGELLRRDGQPAAARDAFERALQLASQGPERRLLESRLAELAPS